MAKLIVGQIVWARDGSKVIQGSVTRLIGEEIFCSWPSEGVYDTKETEKSLYLAPPAPKRTWRR